MQDGGGGGGGGGGRDVRNGILNPTEPNRIIRAVSNQKPSVTRITHMFLFQSYPHPRKTKNQSQHNQ